MLYNHTPREKEKKKKEKEKKKRAHHRHYPCLPKAEVLKMYLAPP